ncbi:hypothetical protein [Kocuria sediminis]|nr:hypothetical protein [Kocuria sediminis]
MHLDRLKRFVARGLIIENHSFIRQHLNRLVDWAHGRFDVTFHQDGTYSIEVDLPEREALESMAGRVRPLILDGEKANLSNTLQAIGYLVKDLPDDDSLKKAHKAINKDWKHRKPVPGRRLGYEVTRAGALPITDVDLALGWLYAEFVHADEDSHPVAMLYTSHDRYRAAVFIVSIVAYHARATLNLVRRLADRGLLDLEIPPQPPLPK